MCRCDSFVCLSTGNLGYINCFITSQGYLSPLSNSRNEIHFLLIMSENKASKFYETPTHLIHYLVLLE